MFRTLDISTSGLMAQRQWMNTIAGNIANVNTTREPDGGSYQRRYVAFSADTSDSDAMTRGVPVEYEVKLDDSPPRLVYDPGHPDADKKTGMVAYPAFDIVTEFVNAIAASRAYEANISAVEMSKTMFSKSLVILA